VQLSDSEKVKILLHVMKKYASLLNWTSVVDKDGKVTYINKWIGDGHGYELARQTINLIENSNGKPFGK
jgi:hypothetical protein